MSDSLSKYNNYLTDLKVGDTVIEHHKTTGQRFLSKVKSIDERKIVVTRGKEDISYSTASGMIIYPYDTKIADFYLLQYQYPTNGTPFNMGPVASDAESLIPPYGDTTNKR